MKKTNQKLEVRQRRIFSVEFKKSKVKELLEKQITVSGLMRIYGVSRTSIYRWLYLYSPNHHRTSTLVVEMESESYKTKRLQQRVAELERIVGQKQLEIDFLDRLLEVGSEELGFDLKKKFQHQTIEWFRYRGKEHPYTMKSVYLFCGLSRQAHHRACLRQLRQLDKEVVYIRLMEQAREIHPGMGLRTMYGMLEPEGIGRDAFVALGLREGFRLKAVEKQTRTTYSVRYNRYGNLLAGKMFTGVNQLWSSDITYLFCLGRFYYLVLTMDVYSRRVVGYSIADNMRAENNFSALRMALALRGVKDYRSSLIHHSDKGSQYVSDLYTETLGDYGIQISMCEDVYENTHIERLNDTIKNQYLNRMDITSERDLKQKVAKTIEIYNNLRPHQSLGGLPPVRYEAKVELMPLENRKKMEIYTVMKELEPKNPNQLNILFK